MRPHLNRVFTREHNCRPGAAFGTHGRWRDGQGPLALWRHAPGPLVKCGGASVHVAAARALAEAIGTLDLAALSGRDVVARAGRRAVRGSDRIRRK